MYINYIYIYICIYIYMYMYLYMCVYIYTYIEGLLIRLYAIAKNYWHVIAVICTKRLWENNLEKFNFNAILNAAFSITLHWVVSENLNKTYNSSNTIKTNGRLPHNRNLKSIHILETESLFSKWEKSQSDSSIFNWTTGHYEGYLVYFNPIPGRLFWVI